MMKNIEKDIEQNTEKDIEKDIEQNTEKNLQKKIKEILHQWSLSDIIMIGLSSVIFGVIYLVAVYAGMALQTVLTPFGLGVFGNEIVFGIWFMAATFAGYVIRKPGVAVVAEMLAAFLEVLMGNFYGPIIFVSGFIQGVGAEVAFASYRYQKFNWKVMTLSSLGATVLSFLWGFYRSGFFDLSLGLLLAIFIVRFLSALVFSTVGSKLLADGLARAGVLKKYHIALEYEESLEVYEGQ